MDCLVSGDNMVQLFVRADRTYCVEVPAGASVSEFLETFEDVSGAEACWSGMSSALVWRVTGGL